MRDPQRERELLADRARNAADLGLPASEMESIFRLLLRASREHQAALRAEVPLDDPRYTIAVIGGHGRIGGLLARLFGDQGHRVLIVDTDTDLSAADAAAASDVTIVSVPIGVTEAVIRAVGPHVPAHGLLMDVTSVKHGPLSAMLASTSASVVGTHPMFGSSVHGLQGQRVVLCRGRGDAWADWVAHSFTARGLIVAETTAEQHDRVMAVVQVLTHFQTQVLGLTLSRAWHPARRDAALHVARLPAGALRDGAPLRAVAGALRPDRDAEPAARPDHGRVPIIRHGAGGHPRRAATRERSRRCSRTCGSSSARSRRRRWSSRAI